MILDEALPLGKNTSWRWTKLWVVGSLLSPELREWVPQSWGESGLDSTASTTSKSIFLLLYCYLHYSSHCNLSPWKCMITSELVFSASTDDALKAIYYQTTRTIFWNVRLIMSLSNIQWPHCNENEIQTPNPAYVYYLLMCLKANFSLNRQFH